MKKFLFLILTFRLGFVFGQTDTLLVFKRVYFKEYIVTYQTYYIDDILATDTVKTNVKNVTVMEFSYSSPVNGFQWERHVKGNILTQANKDAIKSIMYENRLKLIFFDILVKDKNGKITMLKPQIIILKKKPL